MAPVTTRGSKHESYMFRAHNGQELHSAALNLQFKSWDFKLQMNNYMFLLGLYFLEWCKWASIQLWTNVGLKHNLLPLQNGQMTPQITGAGCPDQKDFQSPVDDIWTSLLQVYH